MRIIIVDINTANGRTGKRKRGSLLIMNHWPLHFRLRQRRDIQLLQTAALRDVHYLLLGQTGSALAFLCTLF
jgi:hypothetical protein